MKILMIAPTPFFSHRGCHFRIAEEARFLLKKKHTVKILSYHLGENLEFDVERIPNFYWYSRRESDASWHKFYLDFSLLVKTFCTLLQFRPDILHCHLHEGALIGILLKPIFRKKIIFDCQSSLVEELAASKLVLRGSIRYEFIRLIEQFIYRFSSVIIVSNQFTQEVLISEFRISQKKIHLLPDIIPKIKVPLNSKRINNFKNNLPDLKGKKVIMYLGGISFAHGIDDLISLAKVLKNRRSDIIWILGGYPNVEHYNQTVKENKLQDIIYLSGQIHSEDIYNFLSLGTYAFSLKNFTTQGNLKLLHYALAGLLVVCYDQPSNRAIIGNNALFLQPQMSKSDQAKLISRFLDIKSSERENRSKKLRNFILKTLNWNKFGMTLENIYAGKA